MTSLAERLIERRGVVAMLVALIVLAVVVVVFTDTLSRATELDEDAQRMAASVELLQAREKAGERELQFLETEQFLQQQARAIGFGREGEQAFSLPQDAPSPEPLASLGDPRVHRTRTSPFDDWMTLLFGA